MTSSVIQDSNLPFVYVPDGLKSQYSKLYRAVKSRKVDQVKKILAEDSVPSVILKEGTQIKVITVPYGEEQGMGSFFEHALPRGGVSKLSFEMAELILKKFPLFAQDVISFDALIYPSSLSSLRVKIEDETLKNLACNIFKTFLLNGLSHDLFYSKFGCTVLYRITSSYPATAIFLPAIEEYALNLRRFSISRTVPEIANIPVPVQSIIEDYVGEGTRQMHLNVDINRYSSGKPDLFNVHINVHTALGVAVEKENIDIIPSLMHLGADPNLPHNKDEGATKRSIFEVASPEARLAMLKALLPEDRKKMLAAVSPEIRAAVVA